MERDTLYRFKNGSHLYGLTTPSSDIDYMEVFLPTPGDILGLHIVDIVDNSTKGSNESRRNTKDDIDDNRYSLQRYLQLLIANNPNILETLFVPNSCVLTKHPVIIFLCDNYDKIVSKRCYKTFKGYAKSQEHKLLEKKRRYDELVKVVEFLEKEYSQDIVKSTAEMDDLLAETLNTSLKCYKGIKGNVDSFHRGLPTKMIYEKLKEERDTYGWRVHTKTFETLGYDVKFGAHWLRMYYEAEELFLTGKLEFPFKDEKFTTLMNVKLGKTSLDELIEKGAELVERVEAAFKICSLREEPDYDFVNHFCINTLYSYLTDPIKYR